MKAFLAILIGLAVCISGASAQQALDTMPTGDFSLADLMSVMQVRHLKLGFAVNSGNWPLARYELTLMRQSFAAAAQKYPSGGGVAFADLVNTMSTPALEAVDQAIERKDETKFFEEFKKLTEACNNCHQASQVGFVVIRTPTASPFSNQTFGPAKQR